MHPISKRQIRRLRHKHPRLAELISYLKRRGYANSFIYSCNGDLYLKSYLAMYENLKLKELLKRCDAYIL